ncbi:MAG TPA: dicarboxylate/amino acid:cation symporter [Gemmatimonadaceae bacterium]|nr:dicarboxylate/amino acid:cation symporter [Gemmatimonadaceae bacterium]
MKLHTKILLGLLIGALVGLLANVAASHSDAWTFVIPALGWHVSPDGIVDFVNTFIATPVGQVFLRLLIMIVVPLIFASIALGVAGLGDLRRVGRVGGKTIVYFVLTTALSATVGLGLVHVFRPGTRITPEVRSELMTTYGTDAATKVEQSQNAKFGVNTLVDIVTRNPVRSAVNDDFLGVIFFSLIFGAALTLIEAQRARPMLGFLEALNDIVIKVVEMAMKLAPYGVAALIFGVTSRFGMALLKPLAVYIAVVLLALLIHTLVNISLIVRFLVGVSPIRFFSRIRAPMVTAFSTSSSAATLPASLVAAEQNLGIPSSVSGFVLPLGATMNMNGTSIYEAVTIIFLAQVFGVSLSLGEQVVVVIMAVLTAIGAAGVPGGSIPLLIGILVYFHVPGEAIALILGVDRILDMSRTTVNVIGDLGATAYIAKTERMWDASMIPERVPEVGEAPLDDSPGWPPPAPAAVNAGEAQQS